MSLKSLSIDKILQNHIDTTGTQPIHSILLNIKNAGFDYHNAVGFADGGQLKVDKDYQFRIASITKTFTATVTLQLVEEGMIQLNDPIIKYLNDLEIIQIDSLHLYNNLSFAKEITIQQLLQHRSGLPDLYDNMNAFMVYMEASEKRNWKAEDLFKFYFETGLNRKTHFKPGDGFHYSDVNYLLLTKIIEKVTGSSMASQLRHRIFEPLELTDTYYEYYEDPKGIQKMVHSYFQKEDIDKTGRWSGGGLVSTTKDLTTFIEALMTGRLYKKTTTLDKMMAMPSATEKYKYGMGLKEITISGKKYFGHTGFWGNDLFYSFDNKQSIALSINQAAPPFDRMELIKTILSK